MSDVSQLKAMLTGVFAKAAEAKGKAGASVPKPAHAKPGTRAAPRPRDDRQDDPAIRLDLHESGDEADLPNAGAALATRLDAALDAMGRDLTRLLASFGLDAEAAGTAARAPAERFDASVRQAAIAALNPPAGDARPLEEGGLFAALTGVALSLEPEGRGLSVRFHDAALALTAPDGDRQGRPGLTLRADGVADEALGRVMERLAAVMTAPPDNLEGWAVLVPGNAPLGNDPLRLSLELRARLSDHAPAETAAPPAPKPVASSVREAGLDVRI